MCCKGALLKLDVVCLFLYIWYPAYLFDDFVYSVLFVSVGFSSQSFLGQLLFTHFFFFESFRLHLPFFLFGFSFFSLFLVFKFNLLSNRSLKNSIYLSAVYYWPVLLPLPVLLTVSSLNSAMTAETCHCVVFKQLWAGMALTWSIRNPTVTSTQFLNELSIFYSIASHVECRICR